jgi:nucleoside-diphosphate-sugar epimerase
MDQPHTFTYAPDFGRLLATLGMRDEALGQVWFTPSPKAVTQAEFVSVLESELGRKVKFMAAGANMMRFLGLFNPMMRETVEMMYEWTQPFVVDTRKAEQAFGWSGTPLKEAIRATVAWIREDLMRAQ